MLAHHYYNGYLAELDRQVVKQFGADSPEAETYRQEKEKHENDISESKRYDIPIPKLTRTLLR